MQYCEISLIMYSSSLHTIVLHKMLSLKVALLVFQQYANCMDCPIARKSFSLTLVQKESKYVPPFILCCELQSKSYCNGIAHLLVWENLTVVMLSISRSTVDYNCTPFQFYPRYNTVPNEDLLD